MSTRNNLQNTLSNPKSRVFFFLMLSIIVIVLIVSYTTRGRTPSEQRVDAGVDYRTRLVNPGAPIDPIPGSMPTSSEYQALQDKKYQQISSQALNQIGDPVAVLPSLSNTGSAIPGLTSVDNNAPNYNDRLQKLSDQQKMQQDLAAKQQDQAAKQALDAANKQAQATMARQINLLARNWQVVPQQYIKGKLPAVVPNSSNYLLDSKAEAEAEDKKPKIYYKAGDILFGIMLTSVNSDTPGPILARIVSGPLDGAKLVGTINPATIPMSASAPRVSTALILEFKLLNIPGKRSSVPITAVAIDPQTANTGLATSVDRHYLLRYGTFFAANFMSGLGQAIAMQGQAKVITNNGTVDVGRSSQFNSTEETKIALGRTADAFTKSLNFIDTPPTIKIASGTALGILLQNDIVIQGDNTQQLVNQALTSNNINLNPNVNSGQPLIPIVVPSQNGSGAAGMGTPTYGVVGNGGAVIAP
ncbi:MAG: DotG/IcmE/VirB10 family protein [Gammaproteobacteria bacterium]|nr:DotG/IcmE/VirB10 family protein [Gammaproteobacteria bacterium]